MSIVSLDQFQILTGQIRAGQFSQNNEDELSNALIDLNETAKALETEAETLRQANLELIAENKRVREANAALYSKVTSVPAENEDDNKPDPDDEISSYKDLITKMEEL